MFPISSSSKVFPASLLAVDASNKKEEWQIEQRFVHELENQRDFLVHELFKFVHLKLQVKELASSTEKALHNLDEAFEKLKKAYPEKKQLISQFMTYCSQFIARFNAYKELCISKMRKEIEGKTPEQMEEIFLKEKEKIAQQIRIFTDYRCHVTSFDRCLLRSVRVEKETCLAGLKSQPNMERSRLIDLYLGAGVCLAASFDHASKKVNHPQTKHTIQPDVKARFLQATGQVYTEILTKQLVQLSLGIKKAQDKQKPSVSEGVEAQVTREGDVAVENMLRVYHELFRRSRTTYNDIFSGRLSISIQRFLFPEGTLSSDTFMLAPENIANKLDDEDGHVVVSLGGLIEEEATSPNPYLRMHFYEKILNRVEKTVVSSSAESSSNEDEYSFLLKKGDVYWKKLSDLSPDILPNALKTFKEKEQDSFALEVAKRRAGKEAPDSAIDHLKHKIIAEMKPLIRELQKDSAPVGSGHTISCKLKSPYDLQDVNYPGFTAFNTEDLTEFKLYLLIWFTFNPFTYINGVYRVSKTP